MLSSTGMQLHTRTSSSLHVGVIRPAETNRPMKISGKWALPKSSLLLHALSVSYINTFKCVYYY